MERSGARRGKSRRRFTCHIDDLNGALHEGIEVLCNYLVLGLLGCVFIASLVVEIVTICFVPLAIELVTLLTFDTFLDNVEVFWS
jgi:hypothetical protein